jgi:hypothetical protein
LFSGTQDWKWCKHDLDDVYHFSYIQLLKTSVSLFVNRLNFSRELTMLTCLGRLYLPLKPKESLDDSLRRLRSFKSWTASIILKTNWTEPYHKPLISSFGSANWLGEWRGSRHKRERRIVLCSLVMRISWNSFKFKILRIMYLFHRFLSHLESINWIVHLFLRDCGIISSENLTIDVCWDLQEEYQSIS